MRPLNPAWVEAVKGQVNPCPYFRLQSMRVTDLTPGRVRLEIELAEKHLQPFGIVHGGVYSSLVDAAGFWACYTLSAEGAGMTTVELKLNYLAPIQSGKMIGLGESIKVGRNLALGQARVESDQGQLLAHGTVTLMILPDLKLGDGQLPAKFL
jgi:uncharacterized protein (TIGR00369 family)